MEGDRRRVGSSGSSVTKGCRVASRVTSLAAEHSPDCAEEVVASHATFQSQPTLLYLMTDSPALKAQAALRFGTRLLLPDGGHASSNGTINTSGDDPAAPGLYTNSSVGDLLEVAGEQWLGSLCQHFVVSITSGLGVQSAFRSKRAAGRLHVLQNAKVDGVGVRGTDGQHRSVMAEHSMRPHCWPPTPLHKAARYWSGV